MKYSISHCIYVMSTHRSLSLITHQFKWLTAALTVLIFPLMFLVSMGLNRSTNSPQRQETSNKTSDPHFRISRLQCPDKTTKKYNCHHLENTKENSVAKKSILHRKNIINIKMHLKKHVYKYKTCYLRKSAEQIQGLALPSNMKHLECACGWGSAFLVFSSLNKAKSFAFFPRESKTETSECQKDISGYLLGWLCSSAPLTMILLLQRRREKLQSFRISGLLERQKS